MRVGEIIREFRAKNSLSVRDFSKLSGISRAYISQIENDTEGKRGLTLPKIGQIAKAMGMSPDELIEIMDDTKVDLAGDKKSVDNVLPAPDLSGLKKIPMLGTIACGEPITALREYEYVEISELIKADFCLRAQGESMLDAGIFDGSLVLCKNAEEVEDGQIAAVLIEGEATLKKVYCYDDLIILKPCNKNFKDLVYKDEQLNEIRIIGKAVGCINKL